MPNKGGLGASRGQAIPQQRHLQLHAQVCGAVATQVEIDYKAECAAGDTVDCFGARLTEPSAAAANVNGTGAHQSGPAVHVSVLCCMTLTWTVQCKLLPSAVHRLHGSCV